MKKIALGIVCGVAIIAVAALIYKQNKSLNHSAQGHHHGQEQQNSNRMPSAEALTDSSTQQEVIDHITELIVSMQTREQVKNRAVEIIGIVNQYEGKKYYGVELMGIVSKIFIPMEGILWRMRGIVEDSDFLHSFILNQLRYFKYLDYLYGPHISALFDYITHPTGHVGLTEDEAEQLGMIMEFDSDRRQREGIVRFEKISALQDFLMHAPVIPVEKPNASRTGVATKDGKKIYIMTSPVGALKRVVLHLKKMISEGKDKDFEFSFDRTIVTGRGGEDDEDALRFLDQQYQRVTFIKPYAYTILFMVERLLGSILYLDVYDIDDFPAIMKTVLKKTGLNLVKGKFRQVITFGWAKDKDRARGITPEMYYTTARDDDFKETFMTYRKKGGKDRWKDVREPYQKQLDEAFGYMKDAARHQLIAFVCGIKVPNGESVGNYEEDCLSWGDNYDSVIDFEGKHISGGTGYMFNPNIMLINFKFKYHMMRQRDDLYQMAAANNIKYTSSIVTGEKIKMDVGALFKLKKDWKAFFPLEEEDGFFLNDKDKSAGNEVKVKDFRGRNVEEWAWNFEYGNTIAWDQGTVPWATGANKPTIISQDGMLPEVTNSKELVKAVSIMRYTPALAPFAWFIAMPGPTFSGRAMR